MIALPDPLDRFDARAPMPPGGQFLLGTDLLGRDLRESHVCARGRGGPVARGAPAGRAVRL